MTRVSGPATAPPVRATMVAAYIEDLIALDAPPSAVADAAGQAPAFAHALPRLRVWAWLRARAKGSLSVYSTLRRGPGAGR